MGISLWIIIIIIIMILLVLYLLWKTHKNNKERYIGGTVYELEPNSALTASDRYMNSSRSAVITTSTFNTNTDMWDVSFSNFSSIFNKDNISLGDGTNMGVITNKQTPLLVGRYFNNFCFSKSGANPANTVNQAIYAERAQPTTDVTILGASGWNSRGRGSGTIIANNLILTAAHVTEPNDIIENVAYAWAYQSSKNDLVVVNLEEYGEPAIYVFVNNHPETCDETGCTYDTLYLNYDKYWIQGQNPILNSAQGWFKASKLIYHKNRYRAGSFSGQIKSVHQDYDICIIVLDQNISFASSFPAWNISKPLAINLLNTCVSIECRGQFLRENINDMSRFFPYFNDQGQRSYTILNGSKNVELLTKKMPDISIPFNANPLFFIRDLTQEDFYYGSICSYLTANSIVYFAMWFDNTGAISSTKQFAGIGDANNGIYIGYLGTSFGIIQLTNGAASMISSFAAQGTYENPYYYFFTFTRDPDTNYSYNISVRKGNTSKYDNAQLVYTFQSQAVLPSGSFYAYMLTIADANNMATKMHMAIRCKKLYFNSAIMYTRSNIAEMVLLKNLFAEAGVWKGKSDNQEYVYNFNGLKNKFICMTAQGNCPNYPNIDYDNGPLPVSNQMKGDSGAGIFYFDNNGNSWLIGIGIFSVSGDQYSLYFAPLREFVLCIYDFIGWINQVKSSYGK